MKKRVLPLILIFALLMSFALTACGNNNGASPDSAATADESATGDSRAASSVASSKSVSSASSEVSSDVSSSDDDSSAKAVTPQQDNAVQNDNGGSGQDAEPAEEKSDQSASKQTSSKSDSSKSSSNNASSVSPNPAYSDGHRPDFTIVLTNKSNKQSYSAACSYTKDDDTMAYASFFLPGGYYDIAVYEYADKIDKSDPLATSSYNNDIDAKKKKSIRVIYTSDNKKIEVKDNPSSKKQ